MGWSDYHLDAPLFCTPLSVMRGLVSAACERREALDSEFHESCVSSGASAVAEKRLENMLFCRSAEEIPFKAIQKEYRSVAPYNNGASHFFSFMHMFDAFFLETLEGFSQVAGYGQRYFTDSAGNQIYDSLDAIASALSEPLIAPRSISSSALAADGDFQTILNAAWATQRVRMLKLLRHVCVVNGGFTMRYAMAEGHGYGGSPQSAYNAIQSWTLYDTVFAGWETPLNCCVEYHYNAWDVPEERWAIDSAWELVRISPVFDGCLETSAGRLSFNATDLQSGNESSELVYPFDPLCTSVSSGVNVLVLSSGYFASYGYGTASSIGGPNTADGDYLRGWQAQNVKVVYDYESIFNFKQEE